VFGVLSTTWSSICNPSSQDPVVLTISIPWTGNTVQEFTITSIPSTSTPMGAAVGTLRMLVRTLLVVFVCVFFISRIYKDLAR
jgi:hypothetical protein